MEQTTCSGRCAGAWSESASNPRPSHGSRTARVCRPGGRVRPSLVRNLILVDTWARCDEAARACFLEWIEASKAPRGVLQRMVLIRTATPHFVASQPAFVKFFLAHWPTCSGPVFRKSCQACADHDAARVLPRIKAPTLVLAGDRDLLVPPAMSRKLAAGIPGAKLKVIRGGGHVPWLDRPQQTIGAIGRFLK